MIKTLNVNFKSRFPDVRTHKKRTHKTSTIHQRQKPQVYSFAREKLKEKFKEYMFLYD